MKERVIKFKAITTSNNIKVSLYLDKPFRLLDISERLP